jgi:hemerythrin-like domain-containing protein
VKPLSLSIMKDEHQALAAMLRSLPLLLDQARREGHAPDFGVVRAMLFYIDEFPERLHHAKESELLFPKLRERVPALQETLDRLDRDHDWGERSVRELEHLLLAYEVMGESRREVFERAVDRYIDNYLKHMALEESEVLPAAIEHLSAEDWAALDAAFAANRDPLTGHEAEDGYQPLFQKILNSAPAPIGLG